LNTHCDEKKKKPMVAITTINASGKTPEQFHFGIALVIAGASVRHLKCKRNFRAR